MSSYFTKEEYEKIVAEWESPEGGYDTMFRVARRVLFGWIVRQCNTDPRMKGGEHEEDIMQRINLSLFTHCVTGFYRNERYTDKSADAFQAWMFTVAKNAFIDYRKTELRHEADPIPEAEPAPEEESCQGDDRLNRAFRTVMTADSEVHIPLTWMAQMLLIAYHDIDKIETADLIVEKFTALTLDTMLEMLILMSREIPWLALDPTHIKALRSRLDEPYNGVRRGSLHYGDFYGTRKPKSAISDWVYRMNQLIKRKEKKSCI
ncbi:MAG: hypothetical protein IJ043_10215 [Clostridia bacterium]|nr:hypothetical protein [Clostridia bacterium]